MSVRLNGSTSGYTELDAPAVAGNNTIKLPAGNGAADQVLGGDGAGALGWVNRSRMVLETAKSATGTSIDFTNIPSWVKRVTVMFNGVSTNGSSNPVVRVGAGTIVASGYVGAAGYFLNNSASLTVQQTTGFGITGGVSAGSTHYSIASLVLVSDTSWLFSLSGTMTAGAITGGGGFVTLSGALDRIRITTLTGTDTFDAGTINLLLEG